MGTAISLIFALVKAIPAIRDIFEGVLSLYREWRMSQIEDANKALNEEITLITAQIKAAKTDEERIILHRLMCRLGM